MSKQHFLRSLSWLALAGAVSACATDGTFSFGTGGGGSESLLNTPVPAGGGSGGGDSGGGTGGSPGGSGGTSGSGGTGTGGGGSSSNGTGGDDLSALSAGTTERFLEPLSASLGDVLAIAGNSSGLLSLSQTADGLIDPLVKTTLGGETLIGAGTATSAQEIGLNLLSPVVTSGEAASIGVLSGGQVASLQTSTGAGAVGVGVLSNGQVLSLSSSGAAGTQSLAVPLPAVANSLVGVSLDGQQVVGSGSTPISVGLTPSNPQGDIISVGISNITGATGAGLGAAPLNSVVAVADTISTVGGSVPPLGGGTLPVVGGGSLPLLGGGTLPQLPLPGDGGAIGGLVTGVTGTVTETLPVLGGLGGLSLLQ